LLPDHALPSILLDAFDECLAEGIGFRGCVDAGSAGALSDSVGCEFRFSFGSDLFEAAVRIEELFAGFDVPGGKENHGEGGELECMADIGAATRGGIYSLVEK